MKTLLSCERIFELLTRGPFPSGETSDVQVIEHIDVCHECRELAEALRPVTDVLHESLLAADRVGLPCYDPPSLSGACSETGSELAVSDMHRRARQVESSALAGIMARVREASVASSNGAIDYAGPRKQPARLPNFFSVVSIAAALSAILLVAAIVPWRGGSGASAAMPKTDAEKRGYLLQLGVLESCLQATALADSANKKPVSPHEHAATDCCTDCHFAADARSAASSTSSASAASPTSLDDVPLSRMAATSSPLSTHCLAVLASSCLACHEPASR